MTLIYFLVIFFWKLELSLEDYAVDPKGYVVYCPCMGRFGNQADQFLGSLSFAHGLDRTLILPPWVEYPPMKPTSHQIPFDQYFKVEPLRRYHRVITMEKFMSELAPRLWPPGKRLVFCSRSRHGEKANDCNAKDGNPFGPFWDRFNIDFDKSIIYGDDLTFSIADNNYYAQEWHKKFPPSQYPVLAFVGPPAGFPVASFAAPLQKYMEWSDYYDKKADEVIKKKIGANVAFIGIHLRNGADWDNVCQHASDSNYHLFSSPQCLGYNFEYGHVTLEICSPSKDTIVKTVKRAVYAHRKVRAVFVASDHDHMGYELRKSLGKKAIVTYLDHDEDDAILDLAILTKATHFIGNCISSFSAFVKRHRESHGTPKDDDSFFGFTPTRHDEL